MNIAVFSVIYPDAMPYLNDFFCSLVHQTRKDFTLYLVNDGLTNISESTDRYFLDIKLKNISGTPSAIRKAGIEWVLSQACDIIIFADSDDCVMDNRVATSVNMLDGNGIVFNELLLVGNNIKQPQPMLGSRSNEGDVLCCNDIKYSNCLGFSNTSINSNSVTELFSCIPDDIIAFDWSFFSLCLQEGAKAVFTKKTATYYRQYENNIASPQSFTEDQIMRGVQVKRDHYRFLSQVIHNYESISKEFNELFEKLNIDSSLRDKYCYEVKKQAPPSPLWWETIKTLEDLGL